MKSFSTPIAILTTSLFAVISTMADIQPNSLFSDHIVLQQGLPLPVWGTATPGKNVTVSFAGQSVTATTGEDGKWLVKLAPMEASAEPRAMLITGESTIVINDVLVGEVWICSGQSNMERQLGPREGQKPIINWESDAASANLPLIRQFYVPQERSLEPLNDTAGSWMVCSPDTAQNITAVGFHFARNLEHVINVPIGLIHASWGGTAAEAWTSHEGLAKLPIYEDALAQMELLQSDPVLAKETLQKQLDAWYAEVDPGSKPGFSWQAPDLKTDNWDTMSLPMMWENGNYPTFNGVFWFRRTFELPEDWDGGDVEIHLGAVDDIDTTWINGAFVGSTSGWDTPRVYQISANVLHVGSNTIAVRVLDTGGGGGLWGNASDALTLVYQSKDEKPAEPLSMGGAWQCKTSVSLDETGWPPVDYSQSSSAPAVLFNGMIHPLLGYAIRGVIWYQGEANVGKEKEYQTLFPAMIQNWRDLWNLGSFPFLFVQIAPHREMTPEIREAQLISLKSTENTSMVVTTDIGDAIDIHPANKGPVGARLALAARVLAYGESIEYSGPVIETADFENTSVTLHFSHTGAGLTAPGGHLKGFEIAGKDGVFHPANARIEGETVVISCNEVKSPIEVHYGWSNVPDCNLFNRSGLPASPFRIKK